MTSGVIAPAAEVHDVSDRPVQRRRRRSDLAWALATPVVALLAALTPLLRTRDFYFRDDTEIGAAPIWFHLGERLRAGEWPVLDLETWMAGNIAAEGQWGLWSPITLGIAYLSGFTDSLLAFSTVVKLAFLAVAALGTYLLARTYQVRPPLAFAAGVAVPVNGFTLYFDSPAWVTGLMTWALLPYAWAALRRSTARGANPWTFLVMAYLIVTIGYFHGFLALGVVVIAVGVDRLLLRDWAGVRTVVLGGVFCLLLAVTVFLPGVLTAEVTNRDGSAIGNSSFMTGELSGLLAALSPTAMYRVTGWWGSSSTTPLMFIAWFVPLLLFVPWSRIRPQLRQLRDVAIVGGTALAVVVGPSDLGPLRFPVRLTPYVALPVILALVVLLDRSLPVPPSRRALGWALGWVGVACYLGYVQQPEQYGTIALVSAVVLAAGVAGCWLLLRSAQGQRGRLAVSALALVMAAGVVAGTATQAQLFPSSPLSYYDMPGRLADYESQLPEAINDVVVVGGGVVDVQERPDSRFDDERKPVGQTDLSQHWSEVLVGNAWLLNDAAVQNTYSVIEHEAYAKVLCINNRGETCGALLPRLFRTQPVVYERLADLLSIDTVLILKNQVEREEWASPPPGWSIGRNRPQTVSWVRDEPVGPAGGVVWTSRGTRVTELERSDRELRVRVDDVTASGRMVLSRLAWPGYEVDGAALSDPLNGYLLQVDLASAEPGDVVTVSFSPPGWTAVRASWVAALVLGLSWSLIGATRSWRWRRRLNGAPARTVMDEGVPSGARSLTS